MRHIVHMKSGEIFALGDLVVYIHKTTLVETFFLTLGNPEKAAQPVKQAEQTGTDVFDHYDIDVVIFRHSHAGVAEFVFDKLSARAIKGDRVFR